MVMQKKYTYKGSRENDRQRAPYTLFSSNMVSMKNRRVYVACHFPYYPCMCTFSHYHPHLLL